MRARIVLLGVMAFAGAAFAQNAQQDKLKAIQADPAALKSAVDAGRKATFICLNCHGEEGVSKIPDVPNLAGQNPAYLLEQIRKFGGGERKDQFMQGLIKVLKEEERIQIALFYSSATLRPSKADAAEAARGKDLFTKLCVRCHGPAAYGDATVPRLAGQQLNYLQTSITRYRDGTGVRNNQLMSIATATLKNDEIKAIANYLTQLP
jgi:cytochrome c553